MVTLILSVLDVKVCWTGHGDRESHGPGAARSASKLRPLPTGWPSAQWPSKNSKLLKCQEAAVNYIPGVPW